MHCKFWVFFIGEGRGRFGNQFLVFSVFNQLQKQLGIQSYINEECRRYVEGFFTPESVTVPVLSEVFCNPEDIKSRLYPYRGPFKDLVNDEKWRKGKIIEFYPPTEDDTSGYRPEDHVSNEQDAFNKAYVKHLRENMTFRDNLKERIDRRLRGIAKKYYSKKVKDITLVGVHIRRTDHIRFMKDNYDMEPLDAEYFNDAMEYFKEEYENCMFIVASDDIKWAKKNLDKENNKIYFSDQDPKFHVDPGYAYEVMDNDMSKAAYDFALLTSCNHTIISRGTFSMWIALLTPGEYMTEYGAIVPPHLQA